MTAGALTAAATTATAVLCVLPRHAPVTRAAVVGIGAAVATVAWRGGVGAGTIPAAADAGGARLLQAAWAGVMVAGCVWELAQFAARQAHPDRPSWAFSDLVDPAVSTRVGQAVFAGLWAAAGAWLLRRGTRR